MAAVIRRAAMRCAPPGPRPSDPWRPFAVALMRPSSGRVGPLLALDRLGEEPTVFPGPDVPGELGPTWRAPRPWPASRLPWPSGRADLEGWWAEVDGWQVAALVGRHSGLVAAWTRARGAPPPAPEALGLPGPWLDASRDPRLSIGVLAAAGSCPDLRPLEPSTFSR